MGFTKNSVSVQITAIISKFAVNLILKTYEDIKRHINPCYGYGIHIFV